jgi:membrane fusion protein (multidrug efflux system)
MKKYFIYAAILIAAACANNQTDSYVAAPQTLPVVKLDTGSVLTWQEFPAAVQGTATIEIRPNVSGYLDKIYVEDGAWVSKGQPLFRINSKEYSQNSNSAAATIQLAEAAIEKAQVEVNRLQPLVTNKVIAEVQLNVAKANLHEAEAAYKQAVSGKNSADITLGYTLITAPVSGYISHINFKQGSLIGKGEQQPLTIISEVKNVHAYFSMSEADFFNFFSSIPGKTAEEKITNIPAVELKLAGNTIYKEKGKVELVEGQFDRSTGSINFRAVFANNENLLRSGITGKIRIPFSLENKLIVPQQATYELQDKVFVFAVGDSNKVTSKQITIKGKSAGNYIVEKGVSPGETIVYSGLQRLREGAQIVPHPISLDSVVQTIIAARN